MNTSVILNSPRLRFCVRVTTSAILAFALSQVFAIPLHGLWAVLTAVVVTQMSQGRRVQKWKPKKLGTRQEGLDCILLAGNDLNFTADVKGLNGVE